MPKLKSVIAGLAISTALTGGVVAAGATAADASTQVNTGTSFRSDDGWGWGWGNHHGHHRRHHARCGRNGHHGGGWGWGWGGHRRHHRSGTVCIVIRNNNTNDNGPRDEHGRW